MVTLIVVYFMVLSVSAAALNTVYPDSTCSSNIVVLVPEDASFPDYSSLIEPTLFPQSNPSIPRIVKEVSFFELLPSHLFSEILSHVGFEDALKLAQTCKMIDFETEKALEQIRKICGIVDLSSFSKRDRVIFLMALARNFVTIYPGLKNRIIGKADLISLCLLGTIVNTKVNVENISAANVTKTKNVVHLN